MGDTPPAVTAPDGVDQDAWTAAVSAIRAWCGWHVAPAHLETLRLDGTGAREVFLPSLHVLEVLQVLDDGREVTDFEWSTNGIIRKASPFTRKLGGITVQLKHGYPDMPEVLGGVAKAMSGLAGASAAAQVTSGPFNVSPPVGVEGGGVGLNSLHRAALAPYRLGGLP